MGGPATDFVEAFTITSPGLVIVASPQMTSTLFFFSKKPTPPFNWLETPRDLLTISAMSKPIEPFKVRP